MNELLAQAAESDPMPWVLWLIFPTVIIMIGMLVLDKLRDFRRRLRPASYQAQWLGERFAGRVTVSIRANETRFTPAELAAIAYQHGFVFGYGYMLRNSITRHYRFNRVFWPAIESRSHMNHSERNREY
ncbi:MAG: hypothetical protein GX610_01730 [Rhodococcus sp.]|nr:hypothetical protein [Rhodococcus sp. (in: high G+C Gram-positive bacteria)]